MNLREFEHKQKEIARFEEKIARLLDKAWGLIIFHPFDIVGLNIVYYTGQFKAEITKQKVKSIIDTIETYYWYIAQLKKNKFLNPPKNKALDNDTQAV